MKKMNVALFSAVVALCANIFAATVGDTVSYGRNKDRTSKIIRAATGALTVVNAPHNMTCDGTVIKMDYELEVLLKGKQKGDIGLCIPNQIFGATFYADLATTDIMNFGAFDLEHKGKADAVDIHNKVYNNCDVVHAMNVDHNYVPSDTAGKTKARVMWINHTGSIVSVSKMKITFKATPTVKVLGAVEIDVSGVSNNGIAFSAGFDLK